MPKPCYLLDLQPVAEVVPPYLVESGTFLILLQTSKRARDWIRKSACLARFFEPLPDLRCFRPDQCLIEQYLTQLIQRLIDGWRIRSKLANAWIIIKNPEHCCHHSRRGIISRFRHLTHSLEGRKRLIDAIHAAWNRLCRVWTELYRYPDIMDRMSYFVLGMLHQLRTSYELEGGRKVVLAGDIKTVQASNASPRAI
jgi:hypothetical protein